MVIRLLKLLFQRPLTRWLPLIALAWQVWRGAWSAPSTVVTTDLITAADWNELVNDLLFLFSRSQLQYVINESSNYTTTSTTLAIVDNTNLALPITVTGSVVAVSFSGTVGFSTNDQSITFDVTVDGTSISGDDGIATVRSAAAAAADIKLNVSFTRLIPNTSAGAHTYRLTWKTNTGTATLYASAGTSGLNHRSAFWVMELTDA